MGYSESNNEDLITSYYHLITTNRPGQESCLAIKAVIINTNATVDCATFSI